RSFLRRRKPAIALVAAVCCLPAALGFAPVAIVTQQQHRRDPPVCRSRALTRGGGSADARARTALACVSTGADVALTREAGKNGKLAKLLANAGISSVEVPCIAHQDGPDLPLLPAALADPGLAYVVVTSPEAAKVFLEGWTKAGGTPVAVACVGKATGDTLRAGGVTPVFTPSKATGETLAAEIPLVPPAAVHGAQKTIESGLEARGFEVRRLNTYDTTWAARMGVATGTGTSATDREGVRDNEGQGGGRGVAGGGDSGGNGGGGGGGALAACIGETSAKACRKAGWPESAIFYPEKPGMEGWVKAVGDALVAAKNVPSTAEAGAAAA
ncbi:unnamed protein product, partial [Scytosiphon promiscuus]